MAPKKILFFIIVGIIVLMAIAGIFYLKNNGTQPKDVPESLKVWITDGTSEEYATLAEGFKTYAPEYKKMEIIFEKKTTDPTRYRTLLLSTMSDGTGPDIFMLGAGEDVVLQNKIEPLPSDVINFSDFDKRYDDVFVDLITSTGTKDAMKRYLLGVPLGFETLGMYYNKSLIRELPTTWNELDTLYANGIASNVLVSNIGLGPRYTPNASDIIGLFYRLNGQTSITDKDVTGEGISTYLKYRGEVSGGVSPTQNDAYTPLVSLAGMTETMDTYKTTTLDLFLDGKIGIVLGYPSLIKDLEKSAKRIGGSNAASVILADKIPVTDPTKGRKNIARYDIFGLSKYSKNPDASAKFLEYLLTEDAEKRYLSIHPYMIAAQRSFWTAQKDGDLSDIISRVKIGNFIPDVDEELSLFDYGLKSEFTNFLAEYIDRNGNIDINNISSGLARTISCAIETYSGNDTSPECEKK